MTQDEKDEILEYLQSAFNSLNEAYLVIYDTLESEIEIQRDAVGKLIEKVEKMEVEFEADDEPEDPDPGDQPDHPAS